jgi:hypothetical protein
LNDVAAVGGQLLDLAAGNGLADFVGVRLNLNGVGFYGDAFSGLTDLKDRVHANRVVHV